MQFEAKLSFGLQCDWLSRILDRFAEWLAFLQPQRAPRLFTIRDSIDSLYDQDL